MTRRQPSPGRRIEGSLACSGSVVDRSAGNLSQGVSFTLCNWRAPALSGPMRVVGRMTRIRVNVKSRRIQPHPCVWRLPRVQSNGSVSLTQRGDNVTSPTARAIPKCTEFAHKL